MIFVRREIRLGGFSVDLNCKAQIFTQFLSTHPCNVTLTERSSFIVWFEQVRPDLRFQKCALGQNNRLLRNSANLILNVINSRWFISVLEDMWNWNIGYTMYNEFVALYTLWHEIFPLQRNKWWLNVSSLAKVRMKTRCCVGYWQKCIRFGGIKMPTRLVGAAHPAIFEALRSRGLTRVENWIDIEIEMWKKWIGTEKVFSWLEKIWTFEMRIDPISSPLRKPHSVFLHTITVSAWILLQGAVKGVSYKNSEKEWIHSRTLRSHWIIVENTWTWTHRNLVLPYEILKREAQNWILIVPGIFTNEQLLS